MISIPDIQRFIDDAEVVQVACELVRIPSITHREGSGIADYFERWFNDLGIPVRTYPAEGDRVNFFADFGEVPGPGKYLFNGHQDTKPTGTMTVEPFAAESRDGRMYGRGACDMKSGLAAILCAFKALVRAGVKPRAGITFYSDIEEEYGGPAGMNEMLRRGMLDGFEGLVSGEPTSLEIQIGNRGGMATCYETACGEGAVIHIARFIMEFLELPYLTIENPWFGKCTVNFEKIEGTPDRCIACLDTRFIPETPPELVRGQITALMERLRREEGIVIREIAPPADWRPASGAEAAAFIQPDHPLVEIARAAYRKAVGEEPVISGCPGATIAGLMIRRGTPAIILGPGNIAQAHTDDEWIEIKEIPKAARIYAELMAGM
jgi:acetylornithine deacetylase/succinyl-diaminopimelate desuccinylase-like protein